MNTYLPKSSLSTSFFLALTVILNVNKWVYFLLRILAYIKIGKLASKKFEAKEA
jgi:hypothetical protein